MKFICTILLLSITTFTSWSQPTIDNFTPQEGAPGASIVINGQNFSLVPSENIIDFNGVATTASQSTGTSLTVEVPAGANTGLITITIASVSVSSSSNFTVLPIPAISSFNPTQGAEGTQVTIIGSDFGINPIVKFNGITAATPTLVSSTSLTVIVPNNATTGSISVVSSGVEIFSSASFNVLPLPVISGFNPNSGAVGTLVTINGSDFDNNPTVKFNNNITANVISNTSTSIVASVPTGATDGLISINSSGVNISSSQTFTVLPTPAIDAISPLSGAVGALVTIDGQNFDNTPIVKFGGNITAAIVSKTSTTIVVTVPTGATNGAISIATSGLELTSSSSFTIFNTPDITGFSPSAGAVGATVTITGNDFGTNPIVKFNGVTAAIPLSQSANSIMVIVPASATTGTISVVSSGVEVYSTSNFTVLNTPVITGFSPLKGSTGISVIISGNDFGTSPTLAFNGIAANIINSSAEEIIATVPLGATTGPITITSSGVTISSASNFEVLAQPSITSVNPTEGAVGASITLTGANFNIDGANNTVKFNNVTATIISSSFTSITVLVPAGATDGPITVSTGSGTGSSATNFTVLPTPVITSFNPTSGAVGASVSIIGDDFNANPSNNIVKFNGTTATVSSVTGNLKRINTTVPAGASSGQITLTLNGITVTSASNFVVLPTPNISGFSPTSGAPGTTVTISGTDFGVNPTVTINGITANVISSTANSIQITIPTNATTGALAVTSSGVTLNTASDFTVLPLPTITGFSPSNGAVGATVIISGSNFDNSPIVKFGGNVTATITESSASSITVTVPTGATTGNISVTSSGVTIVSTNSFTVLPTPSITSLSAASGAVGATIVISGTGFGSNPSVKFGGDVSATVTASNTSSITVTVPSGAITGNITVNTSGVNVSSGSVFSVLPTPSISSFSPAAAAVGATVTISGSNFDNNPVVKFSGNVTATINSSSNSSITVTVPSGANSGIISVTSSGITIPSATAFTVLSAPTINSFSPSAAAIGAIVTISGSNFDNNPAVTFGTIGAIVISSSGNSISVIVPAGATNANIFVTTSGVTLTSSSAFSVLPTPTITGFTPLSGTIGSSVTINGNNFGNNPIVAFNGVQAIVTASNSTTIIATVPDNAGTGPISINTNGITIFSSSSFTVFGTPSISGFTPTSGPVGTVVTIFGSNFGATPSENTVRFNGINAIVNSATSSSLVVVVPPGAASGLVSVTVNGVNVNSLSSFIVLPTPLITSFNPASAAVGATVLIEGDNFSLNNSENIVKFNGVNASVVNSTSTTLEVVVPSSATTGLITVTRNGVTSISSSNFTVLSTPSIISFTPVSASIGATIVITGNNFGNSPTVTFGGNITGIVTNSSTSSITVKVPAGAITGNISVISSGVTISSTDAFSVLPTPSIISFSPSSAAIGATLVISGTNFESTPVVKFGGNITGNVLSSDATSITVIVPFGANTDNLSVTSSGINIISPSVFTVLPTPSITSFAPSSAAIGATLTINGTNFGVNPIVTFSGNIIATVTSSSPTSISVSVPVGANSGNISVTTSGITISSNTPFTLLPTPFISSVSPSATALGATVIISGSNFDNTPVVKFGGNVPATVNASTTTSINVTVPAGANTGNISVTSSGVTVLSPSPFTVLLTPSITSFAPSNGAVGTVVVISGNNFGSNPAVLFGNNSIATVTSATASSITVVVPSGAVTGNIIVNSSGVNATSSATFTVLPTPSITSFSPTAGSEGATVVISGVNFESTPIVKFGNINASVISSTATSINAKVPNGAISAPISISTSGVELQSSTQFEVLATPVITSEPATEGAPGAFLTVQGLNFKSPPSITINGIPAAIISSTENNIVFSVPVNASSGPIILNVNGIELTIKNNFLVLPSPVLSSFSPASGFIGSTLTIIGSNFSLTSKVRINGIEANITSITSTQIQVVIPEGATAGFIEVLSSGIKLQSSQPFNVLIPPVILGFSPATGYTGNIVTIDGLNFKTNIADNSVAFNGVSASVLTATTDKLTVKVPQAATTGKITVTVNGLTDISDSNFIVLTDNTPPVLIKNNTPSAIDNGKTLLVSAQFEDLESGLANAFVIYRAGASSALVAQELTKKGDFWEFEIPANKIDEIGLEYKLQAINQVGLSYTSDNYYYVRVNIADGLTIPYASYGSTIASYEMFSVPLILDKATVKDIFNELPEYKKSRWRISHYDPSSNSNIELTETSIIEPGKGYWLLIKDDPGVPLNTGSGKTVTDIPVTISLKAGWNQIGNPYNVDINWNEIATANPGLPLTFRGYNGEIKNFENKTVLSKMAGGFVNVASDVNLTFPVKKINSGGKLSDSNYSDENWDLDFKVSQNDIVNVISGIGMREDANEGFDIYDGFTMPRFSEFLELKHDKVLNKYAYSKDVIKTVDQHTWKFSIESSSNEPSELNWETDRITNISKYMILVDESNQIWMDMKQTSSYTFSPGSSFRIIYGSEKYVQQEIKAGKTVFISTYPNPAHDQFSIQLFIPGWDAYTKIKVDMLNMNGTVVATVFDSELQSGQQIISAKIGEYQIPAGVYMLRLQSKDGISTQRIIIN